MRQDEATFYQFVFELWGKRLFAKLTIDDPNRPDPPVTVVTLHLSS
jgi:hypothetical protein